MLQTYQLERFGLVHPIPTHDPLGRLVQHQPGAHRHRQRRAVRHRAVPRAADQRRLRARAADRLRVLRRGGGVRPRRRRADHRAVLLLCWRGLRIAREADAAGRLVAVGVVCWFAFQAFQNIGMNLGLTPVTGVPLPFVSYGGSSMFAQGLAIGLLQAVRAARPAPSRSGPELVRPQPRAAAGRRPRPAAVPRPVKVVPDAGHHHHEQGDDQHRGQVLAEHDHPGQRGNRGLQAHQQTRTPPSTGGAARRIPACRG